MQPADALADSSLAELTSEINISDARAALPAPVQRRAQQGDDDNGVLLRFVRKVLLSNPEHDASNQGVQHRLTQALANLKFADFHSQFNGLVLYGSALSLFNLSVHASTNSEMKLMQDLDFSLVLRNQVALLSPSKLMDTLCAQLAAAGYTDCIAINSAKVPVLKCTDPLTGTRCDISINNDIAVCNSRMLRVYAETSPAARQLGLLVKYWAKRR
jgi:DNA polymerase sigma